MYKRRRGALAAAREAAYLRHLRGRGVAVPRVMARHGRTLTLEPLPGEPLPDLIERGGYDPAALADALCDWFAAFYAAAPGRSRGDVNGRNFLYDGERVRGVDFEGLPYGAKSMDAGRLAAFLSTYDTRDPEAREALTQAFTRGFAAKFACDMTEIERAMEKELTAMRVRRKV